MLIPSLQVLSPLQYAKMEWAAYPFRTNALAICEALDEQVCIEVLCMCTKACASLGLCCVPMCAVCTCGRPNASAGVRTCNPSMIRQSMIVGLISYSFSRSLSVQSSTVASDLWRHSRCTEEAHGSHSLMLVQQALSGAPLMPRQSTNMHVASLQIADLEQAQNPQVWSAQGLLESSGFHSHAVDAPSAGKEHLTMLQGHYSQSCAVRYIGSKPTECMSSIKCVHVSAPEMVSIRDNLKRMS